MTSAHRLLSTISFITLACCLTTTLHATEVQLKVTPDTITKGSAQPVQLAWPTTLGSKESGLAKAAKVSVGGGDTVAVEEGNATQKSVIFIPHAMAITGAADLRVLDAGNQLIAVGTLHYVEKEPTTPTPEHGNVKVLIFYVALLVLFPFLLMWTDILKAYRFARETRTLLMGKVTPDKVTLDELKLLLADVDSSPPGIPGLARATLAFTLLLLVGIMLFHVIVISGQDIPPGADKLLTLLGTALTSVIAFYFGSKAANESQQASASGTQPAASGQKPPANVVTAAPNHGKVGDDIMLGGGVFGTSPGQVSFGSITATVGSWKNSAITVKVPEGVSDKVQITVRPLGAPSMTSTPGAFSVDANT